MRAHKHSVTQESTVALDGVELAKLIFGEEYDPNHQLRFEIQHPNGQGGTIAPAFTMIVTQFHRQEKEADKETAR